MIKLIAAVDEKLGLGDGTKQPFYIKKDLQRFRELTWGHTILMGQTTYNAIGGAMNGRRNVVASRDPNLKLLDAAVENNIPEFLTSSEEDIWVVGGGQIFAAALDYADELYLTRVEGDFHCTVFFPEFERKFKLVSKSEPLEEGELRFRYELWRRKS